MDDRESAALKRLHKNTIGLPGKPVTLAFI